MTIKVLSNIYSFAFVDVSKILKKNPSTFTAEFVFSLDENDSIYYFSRLKKELKKHSFMINLDSIFLDEFKEGKIRDYVFEKILEFQLFRVENKVYSIPEEVRSLSDFFDSIRDQTPKTARVQSLTDPIIENVDFIILQGSGDPLEILNLAKFG